MTCVVVQVAAGGGSPAACAAGGSSAAAATTVAGGSSAAAGSPPAAATDYGPPNADMAPDAVVRAGRVAAVGVQLRVILSHVTSCAHVSPSTGNANRSPMELLMTRVTGRVYATDAARFDEEVRAEPDVNEELRTKAETQKAIAGVYRMENGCLAEDLESALVLITHLAKKSSQVDQSALDRKIIFVPCNAIPCYCSSSIDSCDVYVLQKYINDSCDEFLFKKETLNLNPTSDDMLNALIRHAGYTPCHLKGYKWLRLPSPRASSKMLASALMIASEKSTISAASMR
ncbi:unnamed protein product [Closterium sp. NIES-53]